MKKKIKWWTYLLTGVFVAIGCLAGYMVGSKIADTYFVVDVYANIDIDSLTDDLTTLGWENKTPDKLTPAEVFQVAEYVLMNSDKYSVAGVGDLSTSIGVSQTTYTLDEKNGDDLMLMLVTYSKYVKIAKKCNYQIGSNLLLYDGTPTDSTFENVNWTDKHDDFTWEGYKETFGKYANKGCSYYVCNKTVIAGRLEKVEGDYYTFVIELDPILATSGYAKQIGINMSINPSSITFENLTTTFTVDKNYRFINQVKYEKYTLPFMGVQVGIEGNIVTKFNY